MTYMMPVMTHPLTLFIVNMLRKDEDKVEDHSSSQQELDGEDGVNLPNESSPDAFVPKVETCCSLKFAIKDDGHLSNKFFVLHLFILRYGHPCFICPFIHG